MIVYLDKQTNAAAAALLTLLTTITVDSYRNLANTGRFQILFDKTFMLNIMSQNAATTAMTVFRQFNLNKKCAIPIEYDASATTGAIGTQRSNNIGIWYVVDTSTGDTFDVIGNCRLRYSDGG